MPLLIRCDELQPGMRLAESFMWRGRVMLAVAKVLTADDVAIVRRKYPESMLKVGDPVLDSVADFEDDTRERKVASTAQQMVTQALSKVQERFAERTALAKVSFEGMRLAASSVVEYLQKNPVTAAILTRSGNTDNYLAEHAGNVFYLALVLGSAVRDYVVRERLRQTKADRLSPRITMNLLPLGLGAMCMDVGMYALGHVFQPGYILTDTDRAAIREHPTAGCEMLPDNLPTGVKMIVRTHHENYDGTGYPMGMPGANQHVFTRIMRICDAFEAATAQRVYVAARSPARVLWEMSLGPMRKCYDPVLAKVFRTLIQPFPIGAKLKLTDGRTGVVVRYNRKESFQPTVIVAFDERGERISVDRIGRAVNVGDENGLRLASYAGEDLGYLYSVAEEVRGVPAGHFDTLLDAGYP